MNGNRAADDHLREAFKVLGLKQVGGSARIGPAGDAGFPGVDPSGLSVSALSSGWERTKLLYFNLSCRNPQPRVPSSSWRRALPAHGAEQRACDGTCGRGWPSRGRPRPARSSGIRSSA
jgi:hypothetical protein